MEISKTLFKEYSKCKNYFYLDELYKSKGKKYTDIDENKKKEISGIMSKMFNEEGDDLIKITDEQIEVMLPYYQEIERLALLEAEHLFGRKFPYHKETKDQKKFSFTDEEGNTFYTYCDGYNDTKDEVIILEIKATTSNKFITLGQNKKTKTPPIFEKRDGILKLKTDINVEQLEKCLRRDDDSGKYFYDFAITRYIVNECLKTNPLYAKKEIKYYLGVLNSDYIYDGKMVGGKNDYFSGEERLFTFIEANPILTDYMETINLEHKQILEAMKNKELINPYIKRCKKCEYCKVCFERLNTDYPITTLLSTKEVAGETVYELINKGYSSLLDIPKEDLTNKDHIIQRESIEKNESILQRDQIIEKIDEIHYPIYHLDFESFFCPLPRFKGEKPYTQSVFQFSIHIQKEPDKCDREKDNYYYLASDFNDHREDLIKEMIKVIDLSKGGTVLAYNKSFESTRIRELIKIFPEYTEELKNISSHIYDLKDVIKGAKSEEEKEKRGKGKPVNYYHPLLAGSYSIKKVLPVFTKLTYSTLDIHNGVEACVAYAKFKDLSLDDIEELRKKLIEYCGLDTYSMVVILDNLRKEIKY